MKAEIEKEISITRNAYNTIIGNLVTDPSNQRHVDHADKLFDKITVLIQEGTDDELAKLMSRLGVLNIDQLFQYITNTAAEVDRLTGRIEHLIAQLDRAQGTAGKGVDAGTF